MATLNPETLTIEGLSRQVFSAAEFDQIEQPPCPVCGTPVTIQRLDITMNAEDLARNGRSYIAGMWDCPRGCDPRTGQRFHSSQTFGRAGAGVGVFFECSCGMTETGLTGVELAALAERHPLGEYA